MIRVGKGACARRSLLTPDHLDKALGSTISERFFTAICFHGGRAGGEEATECIAESRRQHPCMLSKSVFDGPESGRQHVRLVVVLAAWSLSSNKPSLALCSGFSWSARLSPG